MVPKYYANLIYYDKHSKKDFPLILEYVMGSIMTKIHLILEKKSILGGEVPLKLTQSFFLPFFSKNIRFAEHFGTKFIEIG